MYSWQSNRTPNDLREMKSIQVWSALRKSHAKPLFFPPVGFINPTAFQLRMSLIYEFRRHIPAASRLKITWHNAATSILEDQGTIPSGPDSIL